MSAESVLTRESQSYESQLLRLLVDIRFAAGDDGKRMQPELVEHIAALRKDAERLNWLDATNAPFKMGWRFGIAPAGNVHPYTVAQPYGALTTVREGIDAAMEKQP